MWKAALLLAWAKLSDRAHNPNHPTLGRGITLSSFGSTLSFPSAQQNTTSTALPPYNATQPVNTTDFVLVNQFAQSALHRPTRYRRRKAFKWKDAWPYTFDWGYEGSRDLVVAAGRDLVFVGNECYPGERDKYSLSIIASKFVGSTVSCQFSLYDSFPSLVR